MNVMDGGRLRSTEVAKVFWAFLVVLMDLEAGGGRLRSTEVASVFSPFLDAQKLAEAEISSESRSFNARSDHMGFRS